MNNHFGIADNNLTLAERQCTDYNIIHFDIKNGFRSCFDGIGLTNVYDHTNLRLIYDFFVQEYKSLSAVVKIM